MYGGHGTSLDNSVMMYISMELSTKTKLVRACYMLNALTLLLNYFIITLLSTK